MPPIPRIFLAAAVADPELQAGKVARIPGHADAPAVLAIVQRDRAPAIDEQQQRTCHENLALAERKPEGLGSSSSRCRCQPVLQRFASQGAERVAGNKMAL